MLVIRENQESFIKLFSVFSIYLFLFSKVYWTTVLLSFILILILLCTNKNQSKFILYFEKNTFGNTLKFADQSTAKQFDVFVLLAYWHNKTAKSCSTNGPILFACYHQKMPLHLAGVAAKFSTYHQIGNTCDKLWKEKERKNEREKWLWQQSREVGTARVPVGCPGLAVSH